MSFELRKHIATAGARKTIKGNFALPVDIIFEDGSEQLQEPAQVLYDTENLDPETGDLVSVKNVFLTFVKSDLDQEINNGDLIYFRFPKSPDSTEQVSAMFDTSKTLIDGASLGFVRVPITEVEQS